jgi:hypothetical protein
MYRNAISVPHVTYMEMWSTGRKISSSCNRENNGMIETKYLYNNTYLVSNDTYMEI